MVGCFDQSPTGLIDVFFFSASLHRPCKAAGYTVPTATAPLRGLLHCLPCVARLKEANNHQMADPGCSTYKSGFSLTCATPISASLFTAAVWALPEKGKIRC